MNILDTVKSWFSRTKANTQVLNPVASIQGNQFLNPIISEMFSGEKFPGGFGITSDYHWVDYFTLRMRSTQLFMENPYCKGMIKRLLRNEINTGLKLEAIPISKIIEISEDEAQEWGDTREVEFRIWGTEPELCDYRKQRTLGDLANKCREIAMISGDCLVVFRINKKTQLPSIELIDGTHIQTPIGRARPRVGVKILHGVEIDSRGRHIAYWVKLDKSGQESLKFERVPVRGEKSGRLISKLIYGSEDRKLDEVRGIPILASMLYMMKELDRYRDSEQRAATLNSILSLFIEKTKPVVGSQPIGAGAHRVDTVDAVQTDGSTKNYNIAGMLPGLIIDELAEGEKPTSFNAQRPNVNYAKFEEAILDVLAWVNCIPPEVLRMKFQNNFSASRQANNEFQIYLWFQIAKFGADFYQPIYEEYLIQAVLTGQVIASGFIEAWRDPAKWREFGAWVNAEWSGISRPSVDILKDVKAWLELNKAGLTTKDFITRKFTGMSFETVTRKRGREADFEVTINGEPEPQVIPEEENENEVMSMMIRDISSRIDDLEETAEDTVSGS